MWLIEYESSHFTLYSGTGALAIKGQAIPSARNWLVDQESQDPVGDFSD